MSVAMSVGDNLTFEKTVIEPGSGMRVPVEFSQCQITLHCCSSPLPPDIADVIGYDMDEQIEVVIGHGKTSAACVIDACIQTMKNGETCLMSTVATSGENGLSCRLEFQITLLSYTDASEVHRLSAAEKFARASLLKEIGSEAFRSGDVSAAFYKFSRAYKYLLCISTAELAVVGSESQDEIATPSSTISTNGCCSATSTDTYNELLCQCLLNLAACQLRRDNFELAKSNCTKALALDPRNVKGLFRRAKCYIHLGEEHLAVTDLQLASELDPGNREIIKLFRTAQDMSRKTDEKLSRALGKMFQHT